MTKAKSKVFREIYIEGQQFKDVLAKRAAWEEVARMYNGSFKTIKTVSADLMTLMLEIEYKDHQLVFRETDRQALRVEVWVHVPSHNEFFISLRDWTDKLAAILGRRGVRTGLAEFDAKYSINSKEPDFVKELLNNGLLAEKIVATDVYSVILEYDNRTQRHRLVTVKDRTTESVEELKELIDLTCMMVDQLI